MGSQLNQLNNEDLSFLKTRIEHLEKENYTLKRSLYNLSLRFSRNSNRQDVAKQGIFSLSENLASSVEKECVISESGTQQNLYETRHLDNKLCFVFEGELKGHMGAVYDVQFSPEGKTIASGSFDKTVRVWSSIAPYKEIYCLKDHTLNVSDLCWSKDSAELLSGGYDHTCKLWGMENGKLISSYVTNGFVQCVMLDDEDPNIFYAGTSRNDFLVFDIRAQRNVKSIACSSMVNSMTLCNRYLITAHASGTMIVWDMRNDKKITSHLNEATQNAISDINLCKSYLNNYKNSPQYISVNSFDNVLRIYLLNNTEFQLTHALKGHKNKNWPIKSSFRNYSLDQSKNFEREISLDENEGETNLIQLSEHAYVATGSSDSYVYIYNVELPEGPSDFVQKLEGHTDKVYAVDMHPMEPTLCSSSADFTLKIWSAIKARK